MDNLSKQEHGSEANQTLAGGGEMGERMRAFAWSQTPLGPVESWPQSLKTAVRIMLTSRQPIWLGWGEQLIKLYNDPYKAIVGGKHPTALGQPAAVVWREIWDEIGPMLETAMGGIEGTYVEEQLLIMERNGYPEETYYTFSYSPIPTDDGAVGGIICANTDDTQRVIGERQLALLRELAAKTVDARTVEVACALSAECFGTDPHDLPFALIYLVEPDAKRVVLAGQCGGLEPGHPFAPETAALDEVGVWPFAKVLATEQACLVTDLSACADSLPMGAWDRPPQQAVAVPIAAQGRTGRAGLLVVGLNPYRLFDDNYRGFLGLVAAQIAANIANAQAYEEERKRAEALAELDRAKTAFFSNISHELRTPLTLMLGPLEDALSHGNGQVTVEREHLALAHRNGLRLLKLVNTLLDFSRIEAGRVEAVYAPMELATYTAELASVFRSAIEKAGLRLLVDCPPLSEPVYVDREMWEKIVLNLLSNAFKFTFAGEIEVSLKERDGQIELRVRDTGVGIPAEELPQIFERFHRVKGTRGRTYEGTGIGLALVQELARLHGGTVAVESIYERGSTFSVSVPKGKAHLPPSQVGGARTLASTSLGAPPFVEEALRWLPEDGSKAWTPDAGAEISAVSGFLGTQLLAQDPAQARILLADDNADMREYVRRLLSQEYEVIAVNDGAAALRAARERAPDLVLTDVMMPELDGFGLLKELRADEQLKAIPVIMLSARAGEEARVGGLAAGADDYLTKPFSARELLARVSARLELARLRARLDRERAALARLFTQAPVPIAVVRGPDLVFDMANPAYLQVIGGRDILGKPLFEAMPEFKGQGFDELLRRVMQTEVAEVGYEVRAQLERTTGKPEETYWTFIYAPLHNESGQVDSVIAICNEVTEQKRAREERAYLAAIVNSSDDAIIGKTLEAMVTSWNKAAERLFGYTAAEMIGQSIRCIIPPDRQNEEDELLERLRRGEHLDHLETVRQRKDGTLVDVSLTISPIKDPEGRTIGASKIARDITERKRAAAQLEVEREALETINRVGQMLSAELDQQKLVQALTDAATEITGARFGAFFYSARDERGATGLRYATSGVPQERFTHFPMLCAGDLFGPAFRGESVIRLDDVKQDPRYGKYSPYYGLSDEDLLVTSYLAVPVVSRSGEVLGGLYFGHSEVGAFTERHERIVAGLAGQAAIAMDNARLFEAVQRARSEAETANRLKDEFLATVSHELRTPLNSILGWARLLRRGRLQEEDCERAIGTIEKSAVAQGQIIEDILDVSRIITGKLRLDVAPVEIAKVVEEAVESVRPTAEAKGVRLQAVLETKHNLVQGDAHRLQQIVWNLLSNAIKFTPRGGRVQVTLARINSHIEIEVSDTGQGINPEFLPHVFERFRQADSSTKRTYGGLGLGLAIVRHLTELHGGSVAVQSAGQGQGATFTVRLPLSSRRGGMNQLDEQQSLHLHRAVAADVPMAQMPDLTGLCVLVVDDEADARELLQVVLRQCGAEVRLAASAREALAALREWKPDVLVSDIGMPDEDGYELIRQVRALSHREGGGTPAAALTAYARSEDRLKALTSGFQTHVAKPVEPAELAAVVASLAGKTDMAKDKMGLSKSIRTDC